MACRAGGGGVGPRAGDRAAHRRTAAPPAGRDRASPPAAVAAVALLRLPLLPVLLVLAPAGVVLASARAHERGRWRHWPAVFAGLSLLAVGGVNALLPEMQRWRRRMAGWGRRSSRPCSRWRRRRRGRTCWWSRWSAGGSPGCPGRCWRRSPSCGPPALLTYFVAGLWQRFREARWRQTVQAGLTPVTVGLVMAAAVLLAAPARRASAPRLVVLASAAALLATRLHPLWLLAAGGGLGAAGVL